MIVDKSEAMKEDGKGDDTNKGEVQQEDEMNWEGKTVQEDDEKDVTMKDAPVQDKKNMRWSDMMDEESEDEKVFNKGEKNAELNITDRKQGGSEGNEMNVEQVDDGNAGSNQATMSKDNRKSNRVKVNNPYKKKFSNKEPSREVNKDQGMRNQRYNKGNYRPELYRANNEERQWRNNTKICEIVIDVTVWLERNVNGTYSINDGIQHARELLQMTRWHDPDATLINCVARRGGSVVIWFSKI